MQLTLTSIKPTASCPHKLESVSCMQNIYLIGSEVQTTYN